MNNTNREERQQKGAVGKRAANGPQCVSFQGVLSAICQPWGHSPALGREH